MKAATEAGTVRSRRCPPFKPTPSLASARAVKIDDGKQTDQRSSKESEKTSQEGRSSRRASSTYTMRIEHVTPPTLESDVSSAADKPYYLGPTNPSIAEADIQSNWSREFTVLGRHTLEQLSEIILHVLGWDREHLYEFRIAGRVYAHMVFLEEDDLFVEAERPCVSCDIPIRRLGLSAGDIFAYIYDFGVCHTFRVMVLDLRPTTCDHSRSCANTAFLPGGEYCPVSRHHG